MSSKHILLCPTIDVLLDEPLPISRFFSLVPYIFDAVVEPLNNHLQASFFCTIAYAIYENGFPFIIPIEKLLLFFILKERYASSYAYTSRLASWTIRNQ